jgi:hypothetical protein
MINHTPGSPRRPLLLTLLVLLAFGAVAWHVAGGYAGAAAVKSPVAHLPLIAKRATTPIAGTPLATATATGTATATPTATETPTTRDCTGVYPLAVVATLLDQQAEIFLPPSNPDELPYYIPYSDETYKDKWQRRVYLSSSGFSYLRWRVDVASGNNAAITAALTGTGTLEQGFDEVVPWPDTNNPPPDGYPLRPGRLNEGDWIYGASGFTGSSGVNAALDYHIRQRTVMVLPIVDRMVGSGQNTYWGMQAFGNFLLRGYGRGYLDLVYVGKTNPVPCTS